MTDILMLTNKNSNDLEDVIVYWDYSNKERTKPLPDKWGYVRNMQYYLRNK